MCTQNIICNTYYTEDVVLIESQSDDDKPIREGA